MHGISGEYRGSDLQVANLLNEINKKALNLLLHEHFLHMNSSKWRVLGFMLEI